MAALRNALKAKYPTLPLSEQWLTACVDFLQASDPALLTHTNLVKAVNEQILSADLGDFADSPVLPADLGSVAKGVIGDTKARVLLQVVSVSDAGVSAATQLDVAEARLEASKTLGGQELLAANAGDDVRDEDDPLRAFEEQEIASNQISTIFPRSMLRLELSDGHSVAPAFELRRIEALSLAGTPLGTKVLLHNATVRSGHILLQPGSITVLGGSVDELEGSGLKRFINTMRERLGKPLLELNGPALAQANVAPSANNNADGFASPRQPFADVIEIMDDDDDDEEMEALRAAEQAATRLQQARAPQRRP